MTTLREAAQQALVALDELYYSNSTELAEKLYTEAGEALRAALAEQPAEQEPVLYVHPATYAMEHANQIGVWRPGCELDGYLPLYFAPPQRDDTGRDWSLLEATQESLREHMTIIQKDTSLLRQALEALSGVAQWVETRPDTHPWDAWQRIEPAIAALRERLGEMK